MKPELAHMMSLAEKKRHAEVEAWALPRAQAGDADGQYLLGYLVYTGAAVDFATACDWLRKAAAQNHAEALYELSRIDDADSRTHSRMPINETMRARLRQAAELGSERAQHDLAVLLSSGHGGFAEDKNEARSWFERAARTGYLRSQAALGTMCLRGDGGPASIEEGLTWLEKVAAADLGADLFAPLTVSGAANMLRHVYEKGLLGVAPDPQKAATARLQFEAARKVMDSRQAADDQAAAVDAEGRTVHRPFAFANPAEARAVLAAHLESYRKRTYADLVAYLDQTLVARLRGSSNIEYEAHVRISWEDQPNGAISVGGDIRDAGWRTYKTISEFFSMAPDGTVGA